MVAMCLKVSTPPVPESLQECRTLPISVPRHGTQGPVPFLKKFPIIRVLREEPLHWEMMDVHSAPISSAPTVSQALL